MNFLKNAYGFDLLSLFLLLLNLIFGILGFIIPFSNLIGFALIIIVIFRAFSKNISKRENENYKFISYINKKLSKKGKYLPYVPRITFSQLSSSFSLMFDRIKYSISQKKNFKIVKCPNCGQKLRLPRKKGKITVTCKKCTYKFKMRT